MGRSPVHFVFLRLEDSRRQRKNWRDVMVVGCCCKTHLQLAHACRMRRMPPACRVSTLMSMTERTPHLQSREFASKIEGPGNPIPQWGQIVDEGRTQLRGRRGRSRFGSEEALVSPEVPLSPDVRKITATRIRSNVGKIVRPAKWQVQLQELICAQI